MKIVGLTGGIGSGKTTVANMFEELGIPVYIADLEAKKLSNTSKSIKKDLVELLGKKTYVRGTLNKKYVADLIFNDEVLLSKVNDIIHPKVAKHFKDWINNQNTPYCIKEAAILFENGSYKNCDHTILITTPLDIRIDRVIKRDEITVKEVESRIKNQWSDAKKIRLADFVIENISLKTTQQKVKEIHLFLINS